MQWQIRAAGIDDIQSLALIGAATFLETFAGILDGDAIVAHCGRAHHADTYRDYVAAGGSAWLAELEPGSAPIGFALVTPPDLPGMADDGSDLELKRIYSLSRFHGSGIGAALMTAATDHAITAGARRLLLGVHIGNPRAIAFYRKSGFDQIATRRFRVGNRDYDDVVLAKALNAAAA